MTKRTAIVGQAPSRTTDGRAPFVGRSGVRLAALLGVPAEELAERFDLRNLLDRWPGPSTGGKGDDFPADRARTAAERLLPALAWRRSVLCGRQVAEAFGLGKLPVLTWHLAVDGGLVTHAFAVIPHPSSVNLFWNDQGNVDTVRRFLSQL